MLNIRTMSGKFVALLATMLLAATTQPSFAQAEVRISGSAKWVRIEGRDAVLDEVLSALDQSLGVKLRSAVPLQKRINGTYEGPVRQVLPRLLAGYDFIVKDGTGTFEVVVIGGAKAGDSYAVPARRRRSD